MSLAGPGELAEGCRDEALGLRDPEARRLGRAAYLPRDRRGRHAPERVDRPRSASITSAIIMNRPPPWPPKATPVSGTPGVINVTTGPGGINAFNGVFGAWTDSVPMLVISGQVKRETCMATQHYRPAPAGRSGNGYRPHGRRASPSTPCWSTIRENPLPPRTRLASRRIRTSRTMLAGHSGGCAVLHDREERRCAVRSRRRRSAVETEQLPLECRQVIDRSAPPPRPVILAVPAYARGRHSRNSNSVIQLLGDSGDHRLDSRPHRHR